MRTSTPADASAARSTHRDRRARRDGLLPLQLLPRVVRRPVNAFSLWPPEAVRITKGAENVGSYQKTEKSVRKWCKTCGGHLLTEHPLWGLTDVYAAVIPSFRSRRLCT